MAPPRRPPIPWHPCRHPACTRQAKFSTCCVPCGRHYQTLEGLPLVLHPFTTLVWDRQGIPHTVGCAPRQPQPAPEPSILEAEIVEAQPKRRLDPCGQHWTWYQAAGAALIDVWLQPETDVLALEFRTSPRTSILVESPLTAELVGYLRPQGDLEVP